MTPDQRDKKIQQIFDKYCFQIHEVRENVLRKSSRGWADELMNEAYPFLGGSRQSIEKNIGYNRITCLGDKIEYIADTDWLFRINGKYIIW